MFYLFIILASIVGCKAGLTTSSEAVYPTFDIIEKPDTKPVKTISPTSDYIIYEFKSSADDGMTGGMSSIYVVRQQDNKVLYKENCYLQKITWASDKIVRFHIRPEVQNKNDQINIIDFNVLTLKKSSIKSPRSIK